MISNGLIAHSTPRCRRCKGEAPVLAEPPGWHIDVKPRILASRMIITRQRQTLARRPASAALAVATLVLLALTGCNAPPDDGETAADAARPDDWPAVTATQ